MAKTKSESSREIMRSYLKPAVEAAAVLAGDVPAVGGDVGEHLLGGDGSDDLYCAAHFTLAEYLADLHASVKGRVRSPEWLAAGRVAESRRRELDSCKKQVRRRLRSGFAGLGGKLRNKVHAVDINPGSDLGAEALMIFQAPCMAKLLRQFLSRGCPAGMLGLALPTSYD